MTLRISLRDGEQMVVNGAVIRSVGRSDVCIENKAAIMRGREIMTPEEATTPARQLYLACMLAYIDPENLNGHQERIVGHLRELMDSVASDEAKAACVRFARKAAEGRFYPALADCRGLIAHEAEAVEQPVLQVA